MDLAQFNPASYEFLARIRPLLLVCLPAGASIIAWFPEAITGWNVLVGVLITVGIPFVLSEWIAEVGRQQQAALWNGWGGAPTTQMLRYSDDRIDPITKSRIHAKLKRLCPEAAIPKDAAAEMTGPDAADQAYHAAVQVVRVLARENRAMYPSVFRANFRYGFRRNTWSIRPIGITVSLAALLAGIAALNWSYGNTGYAIVAIVLSLLNITIFSSLVTSKWVRQAADVYAQRLLEAADSMAPGDRDGADRRGGRRALFIASNTTLNDVELRGFVQRTLVFERACSTAPGLRSESTMPAVGTGTVAGSVLIRKQHGGHGAVRFRDDPEPGAVAVVIDGKDAQPMPDGILVALAVFLAHLAPVAAGVARDRVVNIAWVERVERPGRDEHLSERESLFHGRTSSRASQAG